MTEGRRDQKEERFEAKTFPVPFALEEKKENISIDTITPDKPSMEQIINKAFKFHSQGNIAEAAKYYQLFINQGFMDHRVFTNYGVMLRDLGQFKEAEICQRKAIKLNPKLAEAHSNLGNVLRDLGQLKEAEICQRKAIELNPDFVNAYYNLGSILIDLGGLQEAELSTRKAIKLNPDHAEAHTNLELILSYLGKLQELILASKSTIESNSINQGYKLLASLRITIANLLKKDFSEMFFNINEIKKLISKGAINNIKDEKNKKYFASFFLFISSLYPLIEKKINNLDLEKIPHFGESHCLSFAHQTLSLASNSNKIQPVLIEGGKAWYFAKKGNNQWKDSLKQQIKNHTYSDKAFISFGEIDCKKDKNILNYAIKKDKDISSICEKTIKGYLNHMESTLSPYYSKRYYFGVPAPRRNTELPDELDMKRTEMIKIFNSLLKKEVLSRGSYFLDVYELTSTVDGVNNNIHMCDQTHLSPKCLSILFENHLYEPKIVVN